MDTLYQPLRQRTEYTHKFNRPAGRHGWIRLTPAYSVRLVEELIEKCPPKTRIYDPFCGTATTVLNAAYHGHEAVTTDINPFLVWLGQAKIAHYAVDAITSSREASIHALKLVADKKIEASGLPPIHNIERWWSEETLTFLCRLRSAIDLVSYAESQERVILLVAFCRTLIGLSNAAFNHQSMSFKNAEQLPMLTSLDMSSFYAEDVRFILSGAAENPVGSGRVILGDARDPSGIVKGQFDRIITSPPYANRMSYIRELRPYMYWLDFLTNGREAGELDWLSIGGTWGIATSRLNDWQPAPQHFENNLLTAVLEKIAHVDNKHGRILANYVAKYFDDMWMHFQGLQTILMDGAEIHYIIGNSTFYGILLPVEKIYAIMLAELGFHEIECRPIRKRNSKKELIEFDVTAIWKG